MTTKVINSPVFKNRHGKIDANWLVLFGFLHCQGDIRHKSEVLYEILQEGGVSQQPFISSQDKDINPALTKLINLVTVELVQLMQESGYEDVEEIEEEQEIEYAIDDMIDQNYLDPLFDADSKLSHEEWMKKSNQSANQVMLIWYQPQALRALTFLRVGKDFEEKAAFNNFCNENKIVLGDL